MAERYSWWRCSCSDRNFFFDRAVSYTSRTISRETKKGENGNNYELPPVYFIAVLGFRLDNDNADKYYYSAKILDEFDHEILYPKLSYKMLVLPNFNKKRTELQTIADQWMYLMKHMDEFDELRNYLDKRIFSRIFEIGELAKLTPAEKMSYISSLDRKRDYNNTIAYAKKEGRMEERAKAKAKLLESARRMLKSGLSVDEVSMYLDVPLEEIESLRINQE